MNSQKQTMLTRYGRWLLALFLALLFGMNLGVLMELLQPANGSAEAQVIQAVSATTVQAQENLPPDTTLAIAPAALAAGSNLANNDSVDVQIMVQANVESAQQGRVKAIATGPETVQAAASVNGAGNAAARIGVDQSVEVQAHGANGGAVEANAVGPGTARARAFVDGTGVQTSQESDQSGNIPGAASGGNGVINPGNIGGAVSNNTVSRVVIAGPFVNVREGPGLTYGILTQVTSGQQFQVLGRSSDGAWWQICCINNAVGWVTGQYALPMGLAGQPIATAAPGVAPTGIIPTATPVPPTPAPPPPTPTATPSLAFSVIRSEQFIETVHPRLYVFMEDAALYNGAAGYRVRVRKDGVELPNSTVSFAGIPLLTWPWTHDDRQRPYNMKIEFQQTAPAGVWEITPIDGAGQEVGAPVVFTLQPDDRYQEMYVRYQRRAN